MTGVFSDDASIIDKIFERIDWVMKPQNLSSSSSHTLALIGSFFFICFCSLFFLFGLSFLCFDLAIVIDGVSIQAQVVQHTSDSDSDGSSWTLHYIYRDFREIQHAGTTNVSETLYNQIKDREIIGIRYLWIDPKYSRGDDEGLASTIGPLFFCLIGGLLVLVGGLVIRSLLSAMQRQKRLLRQGIRVYGQPIKVEEDKTEDDSPTYLYYGFVDSNGRTHTNHTDRLEFNQFTYWSNHLNQPIIIYYDPQNPDEHMALVESNEYASEV